MKYEYGDGNILCDGTIMSLPKVVELLNELSEPDTFRQSDSDFPLYAIEELEECVWNNESYVEPILCTRSMPTRWYAVRYEDGHKVVGYADSEEAAWNLLTS